MTEGELYSEVCRLDLLVKALEYKLADTEACNARLVEQVEQLTAERDELYNWVVEILELARTGLPPSFMTEEQWASHRLNRIAHIASQAKQETK